MLEVGDGWQEKAGRLLFANKVPRAAGLPGNDGRGLGWKKIVILLTGDIVCLRNWQV